MCFTGGFALAAAADASVLAPVLAQPSVPLPLTRLRHGLCALALRFSEDRFSPAERFAALRARLGDAFEEIQIDSSSGNDHGFAPSAHAVLTDQLREVDGHPTFEARKRVVAFLSEHLK